MKKLLYSIGLLVLLIGLTMPEASSQILEKVKRKTEDAIIKKTFGEDEQQKEESPNGTSSSGTSGPSNTRGGGLSSKAPDVNQNIGDALMAFGNKKYGDAKYAIRQAILGVELEIGKIILEGLPESVAGLKRVDSEDNVTSSGIGFIGLIINRVYRGGDQEFRINIGNDAGMLSAVNMYLASGAYATSTQEENIQQTRFKDYRAVIEYDEYSGYKLSVPFGQSSILVTEGINFSSEEEFMNASLNIDIETIKKQLGEQ